MKSVEDETTRVALEPTSQPGLVHVDDWAEGLQCAIEKLPLISGTGVYPVFDLTTSQESMRNIFDSFGEVVETIFLLKLFRRVSMGLNESRTIARMASSEERGCGFVECGVVSPWEHRC